MKFQALQALDAYGDYGRSVRRYDDSTVSFFVENELKEISATTYDRLFPELDALTHIPLGQSVSPGAPAWSYDSMDKRGQAKFLGANATDMPRADASKKRLTFPIRTQVIAYGWTIEEIEAARFANSPLDRAKADAARRAQAELEHNVLIFGDAAHGLPGFLTNPATPRATVPTGNWIAGAVAPDLVIADVNFMIDAVWLVSERVHRANVLLLPPAEFRFLMTTRLTDTNLTIGKFILETNGFLQEFMSLPELEGIGPGGVNSALAYQKDPGVLSGIIPLQFQQMSPQVQGFETLIPTRQKNGGTVWFYPLAGAFGDGI